jgi:NTP pyrophosphatase (non-canonical NTP hydrolase)
MKVVVKVPEEYGYYEEAPVEIAEVLQKLGEKIHEQNRKWWYKPDGSRKPRNVYKMLMLTVSEIAEGMTGYRKKQMDDHLPSRPMIEVEIADAIVRLLDMGHGMKLDVACALVEKLEYNSRRQDHQKESDTQTDMDDFV